MIQKKRNSKKVLLAGWIFICIISFTSLHIISCNESDLLEKAVIWKITGNELPIPSYLFGTIHLLDSADLTIHKTIIEQLKRSETLVFETNIDAPDYAQQAFALSMMKNDSLDGIIPAEQYSELKQIFLDQFGFPLDAVKRMQPFYLASMIAALKADKNSVSMEKVLLSIALEEKKQIAAITTLEEDAWTLSGIPMQDQVAYLFSEIKNLEKDDRETLKMDVFRAYKEGDIEKIGGLVSGSLSDHPGVYDHLFTKRNKLWIPSMEELMSEQSCFFAVGVGHLPGEFGLIRLLKERGYNVRPVKMDYWFHD